MKLKKSEKANLENKKTLFLEIGLCISLGLMIGVFAWGQGERIIEDVTPEETFELVDQMEVTIQEENLPSVPTPRQALSVLTDVINIVDNETQITAEMEFTDFQEDVAFNANPTSSTERGRGMLDDAPFMIVEEMPKFQGGDINNFRTWVNQRIKYPTVAREMGVQGTVVLSFVIERDGSLTNIEILSNENRILDQEAIRVVQSSPKWSPGLQHQAPVRVKFTLPIQFVIQ